MAPTFIGISLMTFCIIQFAPGSPVYMKLRTVEGALRTEGDTERIIQETKALYGLDKPIPVQYLKWLGRLVRLDFGNCYYRDGSVGQAIAKALPVTLQFNVLEVLLIYLIAIPAGVFSATHKRTWTDGFLTLILFLLYSLPSFWVAMLLITFLGGGQWLYWFPSHGINSLGASEWPWGRWLADRAWHMVLPLFCMVYGGLAGLSRYMRTGMLDIIRQDYIRSARAFGFSENVIVYKYAMRNSLIPIVTLLGGLLPALIGGSIIIEYIFSIPGMGQLAFEAVKDRDYPLLMGIFSITALLTLLGLLISDIMYALVDPRIKLE